jgi:transposase InsO family protein
VHAELHAQDVSCCRNTVAKLMREAQIVPRSVRRFRITTDSRHTQASADLVQRRFEARQPNQRWLSDVTYIPTREVGCIWPRSWICFPGRRRLGNEPDAGHTAGHRRLV